MPNCETCSMREGTVCRAHALAAEELKRPIPPPPLGACMMPIIDSYLGEIKKGMKVLEIGCGTWSKISDHCKRVGAHFEGIDTQEYYYGVKSVATRLENLSNLSYEEGTFDLVIGNQTMEHWEEFGCPIEYGLWQCFRVCKPGGRVFMNVPIHFHGTHHFMMGKLNVIEKLFRRFASEVRMEPWGQNTAPIAPYFPHPGFGALSKKPAYVLDVRATRKSEALAAVEPRWLPKGKTLRLLNYPLAFNVYRAKNRMLSRLSLS